jgi:hypothetical protein
MPNAKKIARKSAKQGAKTKAEEERKAKKIFNQSAMLSVREEEEIKKQSLLQKQRERYATKKRRKEPEVQERNIKLMKIIHNEMQYIPQACYKVQFYNLEYIHRTE